MLNKAQKQIQSGLGHLDDLARTRTTAIKRQLKDVETLKDANESIEIADVIDTELLVGETNN